MIALDPSDPTSPYDQVKQQIAAGVADGRLRPGDRLPTVRQLAEDLGLAPNTVARAYRELEAAGVVDTRGRAGTFVAGRGRGGAEGPARRRPTSGQGALAGASSTTRSRWYAER
ncbi:MAG: GntR family transcriptional regulator [Nocardioides sp.]